MIMITITITIITKNTTTTTSFKILIITYKICLLLDPERLPPVLEKSEGESNYMKF